MDASAISAIISNVGFPIAMCILMYLQNSKYISANTDALKELKTAIETLKTMSEQDKEN